MHKLTKELCDKWSENKNINPITLKKIKDTGLIYKTLKSKCYKIVNNVIKYIQETITNIDKRNEKINIDKLKESFDIKKQIVYIEKKTGNIYQNIIDDISNYDVVEDDIYTPIYIYIQNPANNTYTKIPKYFFNNNANQEINEAKISLIVDLKCILDDIYIYIKNKKEFIINSHIYNKYKNKLIKHVLSTRVICNNINNCNKCKSKQKIIDALKKIIKYVIVDKKKCLYQLIGDIDKNNIQLSEKYSSLNIEFSLKKNKNNVDKLSYWLKN